MIRYIDLFAGIGGFHLGLELASDQFQCVYSNEWDKYANSVYKKHFRECDSRDIRKVDARDIPEHDLICGGFPCQAFSIAGKRAGFEDTRGTLFFEIARIAREKRTPYLLLENVKGLLSHDQGRTFGVILETLDELGYDVQWQVLNSKDFGVPQNRERVYIVANLRDRPRPEIFPIRETNPATLNFIGGILSEKTKLWLDDGKKFSRNFSQGSRVYSDGGISATLASQAGGLGAKTGLYLAKNLRMPDQQAKTITSSSYKGAASNGMTVVPVLTPERLNKRQNGRRFKENGDPSFTLTSQDRHGIFDGYSIRKLTPVECERLQGFPDNWTKHGIGCSHCHFNGFMKFKREDGVYIDIDCPKCNFQFSQISDTQRYKMCGNAVTTKVVTAIASRLACTINY